MKITKILQSISFNWNLNNSHLRCALGALTVSYAGKCAGENNSSTMAAIVLAKVGQRRSSGETAMNSDRLYNIYSSLLVGKISYLPRQIF